jgi:ribosomal-protein-alanine N-acetyltransferase
MIRLLRRLFAPAEPAISDAQVRDAGAIATLHADSFRRGWSAQEVEGLLIDRSVVTHRLTLGAAFAGFIMARCAADEAEILSVAVDRRRQGRGLARRLLDWHLRRLAGFGVRTVFLEVDESNTPAIKLYERAGFREISRRPNYYPLPGGKTATALVLRRDLM